MDIRRYTQVTYGHGRKVALRGAIEQRTIQVSSMLKGYSDWPYLNQVFKLDTNVTDTPFEGVR